ncbi:methyltransferase family protein [Comamonas sp. J-3]|uniref:methyltransferase family protein n=1 Tax=Comamonas trifloxystrobinivorans TaxID=3350256 RepID=UPI00372894EF
MRALELKIPPPVVALLCAALMWAVAHYWPSSAWAGPWRLPLTLLLVALGGAADLSGLLAFRRHRTTVNPLAPQNSSTVVQDGIYRYSRNPMYLGMALLLTAWAVWLAQPACLLVLPLFVGYITRFQILPEERILQARFGTPYQDYLRRVRRWL